MASRPPRLLTRLASSHAALAVLLSIALAVAVFTFFDFVRQVRAVREADLATIDEEEAVYRAAWAIEVAARHGASACDAAEGEGAVGARLAGVESQLSESLRLYGHIASPRLVATARKYEALARDLRRPGTCAALRNPTGLAARLALDEELTDAWIARAYELHRRLATHEDTLVRSGRRTTIRVVGVGLAALVLGWILASRVARGVADPLAELAAASARVGRGDIAPFPAVEGPAEVVELSAALEQMRVRLGAVDELEQRFLASVSHELRTPLTRLREALALLADGTVGPLAERQQGVLAIARRACEAEIRLVTTLLDLSRLRASRILQRAPAAIDDAVQQAAAEETPQAHERGVELVVELDGPVPTAAIDGTLLERAIANLIRNAVSVSAEGDRVTVSRALREDDGHPWVDVVVRDAGPGLPEDVPLFRPFEPRAVEGLPGRSGLGLGLALAHEVAVAHGGRVELRDRRPGHTTFALTLPLEEMA